MDRFAEVLKRTLVLNSPGGISLPLHAEGWISRKAAVVAGEWGEDDGKPTGQTRAGCGRGATPEISRFFGIIVRIFCNDHNPAHFHAIYGEFEALIEIDTLNVLRGELPRRAMAMVLEWAALHRTELREEWGLGRQGRPPKPVAPLD